LLPFFASVLFVEQRERVRAEREKPLFSLQTTTRREKRKRRAVAADEPFVKALLRRGRAKSNEQNENEQNARESAVRLPSRG